jgi:hypothetical protein
MVPVNATNSFLPDISPKLNYVAPSSSGMAASGGKVSLITAQGVVLDSVQWANTQAGATGDILFYAGDGKSVSRKVFNNQPVVTVSAKNDFEIAQIPTPQSGDPPPIVVPDPSPEVPPTLEPDPTPPPETTTPPVPDVPPVPDPVPDPPQPDPVVVPEVSTPRVYAPVILNELFIDPVSPESDANDEWIELYNPSIDAIDLSGYVVFSGTSFSYKYVFPAGSTIASNGYIVLTSGATPLSLSNGGGAAKVVSPDSQVFDTTSYVDAPAGQAWAKNTSGIWEWTTTPTEEAVNVITLPLPPVIKAAVVASAKPKTTSTSTKVTAVKAATTKSAAKPKVAAASSFEEPTLIAAPMPIPVWLLAILIGLAVLYVGYEYRFEVANSLYRLRHYRNARR